MCNSAKSGGQMKFAQANNNALKVAKAGVPRLMKHLSLQLRKHLQSDQNSSDETNFSHWLWSFYPSASKYQKNFQHAASGPRSGIFNDHHFNKNTTNNLPLRDGHSIVDPSCDVLSLGALYSWEFFLKFHLHACDLGS
ncbi:hypothetical protein Tco_1052064 [Tanacetum coccineum]